MIVVDASAAVLALCDDGEARRMVSSERLHAPYLADTEVASSFRRLVLAGELDQADALDALLRWRRLAKRRYSVAGMLGRIWELRANLSAYDASYVALAENLGCALLTADARLTRAPGIRCPVTVVAR